MIETLYIAIRRLVLCEGVDEKGRESKVREYSRPAEDANRKAE